MQHSFYAIGYEGSVLEDFVATLRSAGVETLIDVRDVPLSRKPGFSKSALQANLEAHGIAYVHLKGLGDPKPGREAASGVRRMCDRVQPRAAGYRNRECRQLRRHHRCAAVARCRAGRGQDDLHVQRRQQRRRWSDRKGRGRGGPDNGDVGSSAFG
jgi:hypothetical protein